MNTEPLQSHTPSFGELQKMSFIFNAINNGWEVKLKKCKYVFRKKHKGKKETFSAEYLKDFIRDNLNE